MTHIFILFNDRKYVLSKKSHARPFVLHAWRTARLVYLIVGMSAVDVDPGCCHLYLIMVECIVLFVKLTDVKLYLSYMRIKCF